MMNQHQFQQTPTLQQQQQQQQQPQQPQPPQQHVQVQQVQQVQQQQQHIYQLQQLPLQETEVENHSTLIQLVDDLLSVVEENRRLKDDIWKDLESISSHVSLPPPIPSTLDPGPSSSLGGFKYHDELTQLENAKKSLNLQFSEVGKVSKEPVSVSDATTTNRYSSILNDLKIAVNASASTSSLDEDGNIVLNEKFTDDSDGTGKDELKQKVIIQLQNENKDLLKILSDRQKYNEELTSTLGDYETNLRSITDAIASSLVSSNTEQLKIENKRKDNLIELEDQMYKKYLELIDLQQKTFRLHGSFDGLCEVLESMVLKI
ncbi:unnamed protein product [Ambrosiozyma monospora]|uniref:Unnamed protein product n=1 Tax=Ambrosiozyma monospora TaxID=43982 RepID=A0A9W6YRZ0_AMBMO|nr:unnamed protein product [Ambrosiozyma monospora]